MNPNDQSFYWLDIAKDFLIPSTLSKFNLMEQFVKIVASVAVVTGHHVETAHRIDQQEVLDSPPHSFPQKFDLFLIKKIIFNKKEKLSEVSSLQQPPNQFVSFFLHFLNFEHFLFVAVHAKAKDGEEAHWASQYCQDLPADIKRL